MQRIQQMRDYTHLLRNVSSEESTHYADLILIITYKQRNIGFTVIRGKAKYTTLFALHQVRSESWFRPSYQRKTTVVCHINCAGDHACRAKRNI